jgi:hypothetical protein
MYDKDKIDALAAHLEEMNHRLRERLAAAYELETKLEEMEAQDEQVIQLSTGHRNSDQI